ncbi:MAG: VWA domain-containing protein [Polyangiaceae bacterium]|nr:VWA domain-containing protein [Polyangiaceae bacterium]
MRNVSWAAIVAILGAVGVGACGSTGSDGSFGNPSGNQNGDAGSGGQPGFGGTQGDAGSGGDGTGNQGDGAPECAATSAKAQLTPVNLVVMLDRSGSMGDNKYEGYNPQQRWIPVTNAIEAFFADNGSAGMSAALTFFPNALNSCTASDYYTAEVPLTALPNNAAFAPVIGANAPAHADTPTLAAVNGAIHQAQAINEADPSGKAVIVLITDGEPYCCTWPTVDPPVANWALSCTNGVHDNTLADANSGANLNASAAAIASVRATIPTYVIGVSSDATNLNTLASASGTSLIQVDVAANPADTSSALIAALNTIRGDVVSCDFDIPKPPDGRTLDFNKVNVAYTPSGQAAQTLSYSADCSTANSWHFDNPAAPTKVQLCTDTCNAVRSTQNSQVDVVFACVDRPDIVK